MLNNNIELGVKIKCIEEHKPQSKIAEEIGGYISSLFISAEALFLEICHLS